MRVFGKPLRQELWGHCAAELGVFGPVHHAHAATPELLQNVVMRNRLPNHEGYRLWVTAIDEATRYRVLRVYDYNNTRSAVAFLDEVRRRLPFAIQRIQTDNDSSFGPQFTWHLADLGIAHRHIPPASPGVNGKV